MFLCNFSFYSFIFLVGWVWRVAIRYNKSGGGGASVARLTRHTRQLADGSFWVWALAAAKRPVGPLKTDARRCCSGVADGISSSEELSSVFDRCQYIKNNKAYSNIFRLVPLTAKRVKLVGLS